MVANETTPIRLRAPQMGELATQTWSSGWRIGNEVVLSGMTALPATRDAAAARGERQAVAPAA